MKRKYTAYITEYQSRLDGTAGGRIRKSVQHGIFAPDEKRENEVVNIYPSVLYQTIEGFGATLTEAAAYTYSHMGAERRQEFLKACFGEEGLNYSLVRMAVDSCDASLGNYSAVEDSQDTKLQSFSLARDRQYILPLYHDVAQMRGAAPEAMLSPWSPPAFMKTNGEKNHGGKLRKEYYALWAEYFCRYIEEYRKAGVDVSRLTIQNEPNAVQTWDSCCYSAEEEKDFLKNYLYPAMKRHSLDDVEIYIWDHNKERLVERAAEILDEETRPLVAGVAFHWYSGDHFEALQILERICPGIKSAFTEGCVEYSKYTAADQLANARLYGHDMIGNLNGGAVFLINWSILFDSQGGPNHVQNWCEAPVMYDEETDTLERKLSYEYIRHFSAYLPRGSRRAAITRYTDQIDAAAALRPDGKLAVILMNRTSGDRDVYLRVDGDAAHLKLPGDAIATILIGEDD